LQLDRSGRRGRADGNGDPPTILADIAAGTDPHVEAARGERAAKAVVGDGAALDDLRQGFLRLGGRAEAENELLRLRLADRDPHLAGQETGREEADRDFAAGAARSDQLGAAPGT